MPHEAMNLSQQAVSTDKAAPTYDARPYTSPSSRSNSSALLYQSTFLRNPG
jgi:hypothetical protein